MYDAERDFDMEKFDEPLLFGFVTKSYILDQVKNVNIPEMDDDYVEEPQEDEKEDVEDVEEVKSSIKSDLKFPFEDDNEDLADVHNKEESKIEKDAYDEGASTNWMQKYMTNNNYEIEKVPGNGDCFFCVIRVAFVGVPLVVKVSELRNILVDHLDEDTYTTRMERYSMFKEELKKAKVAYKESERLYKKKKKEALDGFNAKQKASEDNSISQQEKVN